MGVLSELVSRLRDYPQVLVTANYPTVARNAVAKVLGVSPDDRANIRLVGDMVSDGSRGQLRAMVAGVAALERNKRRYPGIWVDSCISVWVTSWLITGIGLVVYLYLHLAVLSLLSRGPTAWDSFVSMARSPFYLSIDVILLAGILIHGLNGLRIALTGFDIDVRKQKMLFGTLMLGAAILLALAALKIFGG